MVPFQGPWVKSPIYRYWFLPKAPGSGLPPSRKESLPEAWTWRQWGGNVTGEIPEAGGEHPGVPPRGNIIPKDPFTSLDGDWGV